MRITLISTSNEYKYRHDSVSRVQGKSKETVTDHFSSFKLFPWEGAIAKPLLAICRKEKEY